MKISRMMKKTVIPIALALSCAVTCGFGNAPGIGNVVYDPATKIAPGVDYTEMISVDSSGGVVHAYEFDADLTGGEVIPFVYTGGITSTYKLSTMISTMTSEGYSVICGVNGDFFNMSSGTPLGMTIHDGYIWSTGSNESKTLCFKNDGTAFIGDNSVTITLTVDHNGVEKIDTGEVDENGEPVYEEKAVNETLTIPVSFINESMGTGASAHFYNGRFASSTKTKKDCVEVVFSASGTCDPSFNSTVKGTVISAKNGTSSTAIGSGQFVVSVANTSDKAALLAKLSAGDTAELTVTANNSYPWTDVKEAMGAFSVIAKDGALATNLTSKEPRTCVGIKSDGSIAIFAVDGRQDGWSGGMNLKQIGEYLLDKGYVNIVNLDGGGSTTVGVRMPGDDSCGVVNKPSGGSQRSVANGLFLVAKTTASSGSTQNITVYPREKYVLTGGTVQMTTKGADEMFKKAPVNDSSVSYTLSSDAGTISGEGLFKAGDKAGNVTVNAASGSMTSSAKIHIIDNPTFTLSVSSLSSDYGKSTDINVKSVTYMYNSVAYDDTCFKWSCDEKIGTIDEKGVFTAGSKYAKGNITVTVGTTSKTIPVTVGSSASFSDIEGNWAKDYIVALANANIISGMGDGTFAPNAGVTRAQFVKLLAGAINADVTSYGAVTTFTDVDTNAWYSPYVDWAAQMGVVSGLGDGTFGPSANITREQMTVMLDNIMAVCDNIMEPVAEYPAFYDQEKISAWAKEHVETVVTGGLMNGKPYEFKNDDGTWTKVTIFDPAGNTTRAEAAKVVYKVREELFA